MNNTYHLYAIIYCCKAAMYIIACISFSTLPSQMLRLATNAAGPSSHILKTFESLVCSCHLLLKTQYLILLHSLFFRLLTLQSILTV